MTTPIGPSFVALEVRNLLTSTRYYMDVYGFTPSDRSPPGAVVFSTRPIALALRLPQRPLPKSGPLGTGVALWVACDDADTLHDLIVQRGGKVLAPIQDGPFGRFFVAPDPDGYALTFHTVQK